MSVWKVAMRRSYAGLLLLVAAAGCMGGSTAELERQDDQKAVPGSAKTGATSVPVDPREGSRSSTSEPVALSFAWPPGFRASVTSTRTRTRVAEERSTRSVTSRYTLRADRDGDGLRIRYDDPSFELDGDLRRLPATSQAEIVGQLSGLMPDCVVTQAGEFVGIHDLPAFQARLHGFLAQILPEDLDPDLLARIQTLIGSQPFLESRAAEQWNAVVGAWVDAELELGEQYTYNSREPVPPFPGQQIQMNYSFSARRRLPCHRGGSEHSCAELEMRSIADPEDSKRMIRSVLEDLAGDALPQTPIFETLGIENVLRIVTEPEGLIPHRYTLTRSMRGTTSFEGKDQRVEQIDETDVSYTYP